MFSCFSSVFGVRRVCISEWYPLEKGGAVVRTICYCCSSSGFANPFSIHLWLRSTTQKDGILENILHLSVGAGMAVPRSRQEGEQGFSSLLVILASSVIVVCSSSPGQLMCCSHHQLSDQRKSDSRGDMLPTASSSFEG